MSLSISPVPTQGIQRVESSANQGQEQSQEVARILPERSMKVWQFMLYRLGVRFVKWGYRLQSFAEVPDATTN